MSKKDSQNITWLQVNNIVPIVVSTMALAITYGTLLTRLAVLETKIEIVIQNQEKTLAKFYDVETRYGELALKIERLETKAGK